MLRHLGIRDFVIVDRLELEFGPGFHVLTGETGAGKSILLDALGLLLGDRAESGTIRPGADRAELSASFDFDPASALTAWLQANDCADEPGQVLLRRVIDTSGRSRAFLNGRPVTLAQLREVTEQLVSVHGQNAHLTLLRGEVQRALLDRSAGTGPLLRRVEAAWHDWRTAEDALQHWSASRDAWSARRATLRDDIAELAPLVDDPTALESLEAEHRRLAGAQQLIDATTEALAAIDDSDIDAQAQVGRAAARLGNVNAIDPRLQPIEAALYAAATQLAEAASDLRRYIDRIELDPGRLREVESRLAELQRIARKHRCTVAELPALLARLRDELDSLGGDDDGTGLQQRRDNALGSWQIAAAELSAVRQHAATELAAAVTACMQTLSLQGGRFCIDLPPEPRPTAHGAERVEFSVSANAGMPPGPLDRVASGGELSRIGLALSTVAAVGLEADTLVFDEVDAGIGGGVAEVVGRLLQRLGEQRQILCVTHLPQVAACADEQYQVSKEQRDGLTCSRVTKLDHDGRIDELARMLGGLQITATTRSHADELLASLGRSKARGVAGAHSG